MNRKLELLREAFTQMYTAASHYKTLYEQKNESCEMLEKQLQNEKDKYKDLESKYEKIIDLLNSVERNQKDNDVSDKLDVINKNQNEEILPKLKDVFRIAYDIEDGKLSANQVSESELEDRKEQREQLGYIYDWVKLRKHKEDQKCTRDSDEEEIEGVPEESEKNTEALKKAEPLDGSGN